MKLIKIVFTTNPLNIQRLKNAKRYRFLTDNNDIEVGDMIIDCRYDKPMVVVEIQEITTEISSEIKPIIISELKKNKDMEESKKKDVRTLEVSLQEARCWYKSDIAGLKELALKLFSEKELKTVTYEDIKTGLKMGDITVYNIEENSISRLSAFIKLNNIARYFRKKYNPDNIKDMFYINYTGDPNLQFDKKLVTIMRLSCNTGSSISLFPSCNMNIMNIPASTPIFYSYEDAKEAIRIMDEELNKLVDLFK